MRSQLKQDLLHLKGSWERLDQNSAPNGAKRHANVRLREGEDIIPETGFAVVLHLRKVEIRSRSALDEFLGVVIEIHRKVKHRCGDRSIVDRNAGFIKMPAAGSACIRMLAMQTCKVEMCVPDNENSGFL